MEEGKFVSQAKSLNFPVRNELVEIFRQESDGIDLHGRGRLATRSV